MPPKRGARSAGQRDLKKKTFAGLPREAGRCNNKAGSECGFEAVKMGGGAEIERLAILYVATGQAGRTRREGAQTILLK